MRESNYCAHAIDSLKALARKDIPPYLGNSIERIVPRLRDAVHFRLPEDGKVFNLKSEETILGVLNNYCPKVRLPYPIISLEFAYSKIEQGPPPEGAAVVLATVLLTYEHDEGGVKYIVLRPLFQALECDGSKQWYPATLGASLNIESRDITTFGQHRRVEDEELDSGYAFVLDELHGALTVFVQFLAALSCSNTATRDALPPSASLNVKRAKTGKTPFFTYKELTLSSQGSPYSDDYGGTHGSPRVHLRRGHIRRLPGKTVWVNACVVGDKSKGLVYKDYKLE